MVGPGSNRLPHCIDGLAWWVPNLGTVHRISSHHAVKHIQSTIIWRPHSSCACQLHGSRSLLLVPGSLVAGSLELVSI